VSDLPTTETIPFEAGRDGVMRISGMRATLDTISAAFWAAQSLKKPHSAIPSAPLADVYRVLSYCLRRSSEIQSYLDRRRVEAERVRMENESRSDPADIRQRLMARIASGRL